MGTPLKEYTQLFIFNSDVSGLIDILQTLPIEFHTAHALTQQQPTSILSIHLCCIVAVLTGFAMVSDVDGFSCSIHNLQISDGLLCRIERMRTSTRVLVYTVMFEHWQ